MSIDPAEARAALADMQASRRRFRHSARWGWGYSIAFGALLAWLLAIQALPLVQRAPAYLVFILGIVAMVRWQRRATGRFVNGYRAGRTRWVAIGLVALFAPLCLYASWLDFTRRLPLAPLYAAPFVFLLATLGDRLWIRAYDRDMEESR